MKKIVALTLVLTFSASAAFAAATTKAFTDTDTTAAIMTAGELVFKLSKNVLMSYKSADDNTGYSISAYHNKGTKTFGSSSGDSKIFENAATAVACPAAPVGTASADFSGWTAL